MIKNILFALVFIVAAPATPELPPAASVRPVKVAEVPGYTEGVVVGADGAVYISDVYNGTIYRVRGDSAPEVWAKTGAPNGHKILPDGTHLVCDGSQHAVLRLDAEGRTLGKASSRVRRKTSALAERLDARQRRRLLLHRPGRL